MAMGGFEARLQESQEILSSFSHFKVRLGVPVLNFH